MTFDVAADAYQRFMGGYSDPLGEEFVRSLELRPGQTALDVGAGPGAVTVPLVAVLGADHVAAVDPSHPFVEALATRVPGVDARVADAENLPYPDGAFDAVVAQLVVNFMADAAAGLREMVRVAAPGGMIAASVWDFGGGRAPLSAFWSIARELDPHVSDEANSVGARVGDLAALFEHAQLDAVLSGELTVEVPYADLDEWWEPYTLGVGPAGAYVAGLDSDHRDALRRRAADVLPASGSIRATAWVAYGRSAS